MGSSPNRQNGYGELYQPGGEGVEEEGDVELGDVLDGDAAEKDQGDWKSNVEEDEENIEDTLKLFHGDV